ncbi:MAG: hypothetical protein U0T77_10625 [Chitinophagales bacterium]
MVKENLYQPNCIRTFSGKYVNILEPHPDMFCISDIAHALSNQCRFGGHLPQFYSVAQHSWLCTQLISDKNKYNALMHDSSEAYLLDIPTPLKSLLTNYKEIEDRLMKVLAEKFQFEYPLNDEVKSIDKIVLELEWNQLMLQKDKIKYFSCFSQGYANTAFMNQYYQLRK